MGMPPLSWQRNEIDTIMTELASLPDSICNAGDYLAVLRSLSRAVESGLAALSAGQLVEFKEQLVRQEDCCSLLSVTRIGEPDPAVSDVRYALYQNDRELAAGIHAEHDRLARLNRLYQAMLRRSARTVGLLANHSQTYLRTVGEAGDGQSIGNVFLAEA